MSIFSDRVWRRSWGRRRCFLQEVRRRMAAAATDELGFNTCKHLFESAVTFIAVQRATAQPVIYAYTPCPKNGTTTSYTGYFRKFWHELSR